MAYFADNNKINRGGILFTLLDDLDLRLIVIGLTLLVAVMLFFGWQYFIKPNAEAERPGLVTLDPNANIMKGLAETLKDLRTLSVELIPMGGDSIAYSYKWDDNAPETLIITNKNIIGRLLTVLPNYPDSQHITIQVVGPEKFMSRGGE